MIRSPRNVIALLPPRLFLLLALTSSTGSSVATEKGAGREAEKEAPSYLTRLWEMDLWVAHTQLSFPTASTARCPEAGTARWRTSASNGATSPSS